MSPRKRRQDPLEARIHPTPCSWSCCLPHGHGGCGGLCSLLSGCHSPSPGLPSHLPLRHFTQDLLSLSQLGIWGLRGGRKGNGIEPKGNPTPRSGLGRRHTMGEEAGTRLNLLRVWGHLEGAKERSGVQVPSSAAPSLHSSLETGAGGPKNSPRGAIASRPPW